MDHDFAHDVTPVELHTLKICLNWLITKLKLDWNKIDIDLSSWKNSGNIINQYKINRHDKCWILEKLTIIIHMRHWNKLNAEILI